MSKTTNIAVSELSKHFRRGKETFVALNNVSLSIDENEFVAVVGTSGCGKTTLLNIISGLSSPTSGQVFVNGRAVNGPGRERGVVFQQDALFMWRSVRRNVEYGLEVQGIPKNERGKIAFKWLRLVGLEAFADFWPKELSGGMKKRCQVAVVLANEPGVLFMDEPYGALDYSTKCELQHELLRVLSEQPKTVFFVTHDIEEAVFLADRVVVMAQGAISNIHDIPFDRPRTQEHRFSAEFNELRRVISNEIEVLPGKAKLASKQ